MHYTKAAVFSLASILILACTPTEKEEINTPAATARETANDQAKLASLDTAKLHELAAQALRDKNTYSPAGSNAVEYYLAIRDKSTDHAVIGPALVELQPYVMIASEQAIASGQLDEAGRLIALLDRIDATAPALPRLREQLARTDALRVVAEDLARREVELQAQTLAEQSEQQARQRAAQQAAIEAERANVDRMFTSVRPPEPLPAGPISDAPTPANLVAPGATLPAAARTAAPVATASMPSQPALPRLLKDVAPRYPMIALNRGIEGSVQVTFSIGADGVVRDARVVSANPAKVFDQAALNAVSQWRFEAAGAPVVTTRTLNFSLDRKS